VYDPSSATPLDQNSTISVRCTRTTPFTVALNAGGAGGTFASRVMRDAATPTPNTLSYNLFTTTGRTTVWGDGTAGTSTLAGVGLGLGAGNNVDLTVFGRIPVQPTAVPASYSDSITVTVTY
ncbi:MAG TPA: spore coat U domain-containing protein, partial [Burkholderiaceae bacterium]|nr:spore coat U domain-containing protein [Burkholderiaceae bacterium]